MPPTVVGYGGKPQPSARTFTSANGGISRRDEVALAPLERSGLHAIEHACRHCLGGRYCTTASMEANERETRKREREKRLDGKIEREVEGAEKRLRTGWGSAGVIGRKPWLHHEEGRS